MHSTHLTLANMKGWTCLSVEVLHNRSKHCLECQIHLQPGNLRHRSTSTSTQIATWCQFMHNVQVCEYTWQAYQISLWHHSPASTCWLVWCKWGSAFLADQSAQHLLECWGSCTSPSLRQDLPSNLEVQACCYFHISKIMKFKMKYTEPFEADFCTLFNLTVAADMQNQIYG